MEWEKCIICGKGDGDLQCPAEKPDEEGREQYENFVKNVTGFQELQALPAGLVWDGLGGATELYHHHAKWHKACHLKFTNSKLERARECHENKC